MSESLGVEEKTIKMIVRILREAGLFTTGARGVNAPDITSLDAVRVVLAVLASLAPSRAIRDVLYFGQLKPDLREEWTDNTILVGLDPEKTLEQTLVDCMENRLPYMNAIFASTLRLSDTGDASIIGASGDQDYHQREQWAAVVKTKYPGGSDDPKKKAANEAWESMHRISKTKINRSAELPMEVLHQIGFEMIGWEVD